MDPFMRDILAAASVHLFQELQRVRFATDHSDHESSDDENTDPPGFVAAAVVRTFIRGLRKVPRGGHGEEHQKQLAR